MGSVDVIVPCYRYGNFLRECVESVLAQDVEVRALIIDDASPDNTAEVAEQLVREDSRVAYRRHPTNKGHIATYNEGIEWAAAEYLLLLSADDYLLPGALRRAVDLMDSHPEVGFTFGDVVRLSEAGTFMPLKTFAGRGQGAGQRIFTGWDFIKASGSTSIVWTPTAVVRTALQKRVGGYRSDLPHSGDMEMWLRLAAHAQVGFVEALQAVYRRHVENMSIDYMLHNRVAGLKQRQAALDAFYDSTSAAMPDAHLLHRRALRSLSHDAIGMASAAFNAGELRGCHDLAAIAMSLCPQAKRSWPWIKLVCKRGMGLAAWRALAPLIAALRRMTRRSDGGQSAAPQDSVVVTR